MPDGLYIKTIRTISENEKLNNSHHAKGKGQRTAEKYISIFCERGFIYREQQGTYLKLWAVRHLKFTKLDKVSARSARLVF